ncbi:MAG: histidine phosphatase family protein [Bacteroidales bacterium]|nr:histidine phosphatase family protein [Bacteroidales bacterium]
MKTLVYLVRHGETHWNLEQRLQGQLDSPLTEEGIRQATAMAGKLSGIRFDAIYSSDLERARHTAQIITSRFDRITIRYDNRIRERHFGSFQGLTWKEIAEKFPDEAARELSRDPMNKAPGGESKHQLLARTVDFFDDIATGHPGERVLVISHGGVLNVWIRHVLQLPFETPRRFHLPNAAINIFECICNQWFLKTLGMDM